MTKEILYRVNYRLLNEEHATGGSMVVSADDEADAKLKVIEKYNDLYAIIAEPGEGTVLPTFTGVELMEIDDDPDDVEYDQYCEGRARGFEFIRDNILKDEMPEPVIAGIIDEFAQFLVEMGVADEFRETLAHTEQLNEEMEED